MLVARENNRLVFSPRIENTTHESIHTWLKHASHWSLSHRCESRSSPIGPVIMPEYSEQPGLCVQCGDSREREQKVLLARANPSTSIDLT